ncbi:hypothetical protein FB446DRAFT_299837 [Lentinula raphanica]|nr:hypothetical protein FB446DRAFT_299837 [Lentinula raphanica]
MFTMRVIAHACLFLQLIVGLSAVAVYSLPAPVDDHGGHKSTLAPVEVHDVHNSIPAITGGQGVHTGRCPRHKLPVVHTGALVRRTEQWIAYVTFMRPARDMPTAQGITQSREQMIKTALQPIYGDGIDVRVCDGDTMENIPIPATLAVHINMFWEYSDGVQGFHEELIGFVDASTGGAVWRNQSD